jgi:fatty-acyl-CoA synthase
MEHPGVQQAACIAIAHPKWDERPLLLVVPREGVDIGKQELLRFIEGRIAQWWMPDDVLFLPSLPLGATGKVLKKQLREQYGGYRPAAA